MNKMQASNQQNMALSQRYQNTLGASQIGANQRGQDASRAGQDYYNYQASGMGQGYPYAIMGGAPYGAGNIGFHLGIGGGLY